MKDIEPMQVEITSDVRSRALEHALRDPWMIQQEALETILLIASRSDVPEALQKKRGRPLGNGMRATLRGSTAVVPIAGPIFRYANIFTDFSGATSLQMLSKEFTKAVEDPSVRAIVLDIDSPGGQVNGTSEFADMIFEARSEKPIIAYVSHMGASAAYWIASSASQIVASPTSHLGSIGCVMGAFKDDDSNLIEVVSSQSPKKRLDPDSSEGRADMQGIVDSLADVFVNTVARNRGVSSEKVIKDFGQGSMLIGADAVGAGLADSVGSLEKVLAGLAGEISISQEVFVMTDKQTQSPEITREFIAEKHPAIKDSFVEEGLEKGREEGATAERDRIKAVAEQFDGFAGHEELRDELMYDGKTTGPEAAVALLKAEKQAAGDELAKRRDESAKPLKEAKPDDAAAGANDNLPIEDRCKAEWAADPDLRDEFMGEYDSYLAYCKALEAGQIKQRKSA